MQQAYGNITIQVPELPEDESTEALCGNKALIAELITTIVSILISILSKEPFEKFENWLF